MSDPIKKMAQLLKDGATMLDLYCPQCNSILFKLTNGKIFCPNCNQEVIVVKDEKEAERIRRNANAFSSTSSHDVIRENDKSSANNLYDKTESSISALELEDFFIGKLTNLIKRIDNTDDVMTLNHLYDLVIKNLQILEKIRNL